MGSEKHQCVRGCASYREYLERFQRQRDDLAITSESGREGSKRKDQIRITT